MGKTNKGIIKSRVYINGVPNGISQDGSYTLQPEPNVMNVIDYHEHDWHLSKDYQGWYKGPYCDISKFVCLCGAVKRVKQFEVEE